MLLKGDNMLFDNTTIQNIKAQTKDFNWFLDQLDSSFQIPSSQDIVIFGFNGIGKSTLVRLLKLSGDSSLFFFDYENEGGRADLNGSLSKKNEVSIKVDVSKIADFENQISNEKQILEGSVKAGLKDEMGISNATMAKKYTPTIRAAQSKQIFRQLSSSPATISQINTLLGNVPPKVFVDCDSELKNFGAISSQIQAFKDEHLFSALKELDPIVDPTTSTCPICGSNAAGIKKRIQSLINQLGGARNVLSVKVEKEYGVQLSQTQLQSLLLAYNTLQQQPSLLEDYLICGGDTSRFTAVNSSLSKIAVASKAIAGLNAQAQIAYTSVLSQKQRFEDDMINYFLAAHESVADVY